MKNFLFLIHNHFQMKVATLFQIDHNLSPLSLGRVNRTNTNDVVVIDAAQASHEEPRIHPISKLDDDASRSAAEVIPGGGGWRVGIMAYRGVRV